MDERSDLRVMKSLDTFHAVSCRDAASLERDGETYYAINNLRGVEGIEWEVMFADGQWMIARLEDLNL